MMALTLQSSLLREISPVLSLAVIRKLLKQLFRSAFINDILTVGFYHCVTAAVF